MHDVNGSGTRVNAGQRHNNVTTRLGPRPPRKVWQVIALALLSSIARPTRDTQVEQYALPGTDSGHLMYEIDDVHITTTNIPANVDCDGVGVCASNHVRRHERKSPDAIRPDMHHRQ